MSVESDYRDKHESEKQSNFVKTAESSEFKRLLSQRKKFIVPCAIFFLIFYFTLPVLTSYTSFLNQPVIGDISWAWIFALSQFVMTWILCTIYVKKSANFDKQANEIIEDQLKEEDTGR
ncbi:DUF485 domain-containing protein [Virgibacillus ainsalahensis]